jgi:2-amino-4-hydroxy-6-hydroxymethyldihydropteridine diphosphokinase
MPTVYLSLGTNIGDRLANLRAALAALPDLAACSSVYETEPWGSVDQPRVLNMCCRLDTSLTPEVLHARLKALERELGRTPSLHWGPRLIDIDLLTYDNDVIQTDALTVPHPRIADRAFVLMPLAELDPELRIPGLPGTIAQQLAGLPGAASQAWRVARAAC